MSKQSTQTIRKHSNGSIRSIFMHADGADIFLMSLGFLGAVGDGIAAPIMFFITSTIMNNIGDFSSLSTDVFTDKINKDAEYLCFLAIGKLIACFLEGYCWARTAERQASKLRLDYLKAVLRQEVAYFDLNVASTSEIITSISSDSLIIQEVISEKVPSFIMYVSICAGAYVVAFILLWRLAIVALPFITCLVIPGLIYGRVLMRLSRKIREEYNKAGMVAEQAISSVRTVYSFVGENKTLMEYSVSLQSSVKLGLKQGLAKGIVVGSNGVIFAVWSFLCWYGSRLVMYHGAKGGTVFAVGAAVNYGGISLGSALSTLRYFSDAMTAGERIREVIKRVPEIDSDNMEGEILQEVSGEVEFKNVKFAYPSRPESVIFRDFNLKVPAGKTVALVGGSGSGKSTVIALLQRFYDPQGGQICVDGVRIDKLQLKWLRSQMGLVSQEPALFATSIKENIIFGKEDASMDEVIEASKASNAHNFISQLPQAYDTQVGERGIQISGGQKQRIAIARAIIKSPRILLLDEATSALDSESERVVQEALDQAAVGRTTIVIAHRLSTIRNADVIVVVQDGQVVESGSHDDLIQLQNGFYKSLVHLQQTKQNDYEPAPPGPSSTYDVPNMNNRQQSIVSRSNSANHGGGTGGDKLTSQPHVDQVFPVPSFKRLLAMNIPELRQALCGSVGAILFGAVQPVYSFAMGSMISVYFLDNHDEIKHKTMIYSLWFASLAVFTMVVNIIQHYNFAAMGEYLTKRVREKMLSKILAFEIGWFDKAENLTGALCSRLAKDANVVRSLVGDRCSLLIQTFSAVTVASTMGLVIAWRLALVMIAVQPLIIFAFYSKRVLLKIMSQKAMKAQEESSKLAAEAVSNLRTVTAFSSQTRILKMLQETQKAPLRESIRQAWYAGFGLAFSQSLIPSTWALAFWYGGTLTYLILISTGRVIADAGTMTNDLAKGSDAVQSVFEVLDRHTLIEPEDADGNKPKFITGHVEIRDVDFAYPARPDVMIFKGFSINIEAGKSTALVGQSGSGKSTIIGLIERFYDPMKGVVKVDGRDIKSYHLRTLRKYIALVSQEPTLFAGTIHENIIYGASGDVTESEVIEAAKAANAHDFIAVLKDGYDTWCGDRGVQLSGGQKQRVAIARAILKNPAVLLLDEATSALDSQSEKVVQDALERMMVGRTSVVVAHRLSTIQSCDTIAVLEKGKVAENGNHGSLLAKGPTGAYYSLSTEPNRKFSNGSVRSIFMHADSVDMFLMTLGIIGAVGDEGYCWTRTAERQASRLRSAYLKAVLRQEVAYFDLNVTSTAEIIASVSSDSLVIQEVISEKVPVFLMSMSNFCGAYVVSLILLWRLAIVGFPFVIILVFPGLIYGRVLMRLSRKMREEYNKAGAVAEQAISSVRTVYSFVGENKTITEYSAALQATVELGLKQGLAKGITIGCIGVAYAVLSFLCWYGSRLVMYHGAKGGTVFVVAAAICSGGLSLGNAWSNVKYFSDAMAAGERIREVTDRVPLIDSDNMEGRILEEVSGEVEFKNVKFAYPSRPESMILKDFNLKVPPGKTVALVGGSGSGKSTVIALLQRFYDPKGGEIRVDGVSIDKLQLKWLRSQMGLVSQEPALFATSIKENILFGKEDATIDEVIEAAKASNAHNFISQLPQTYDTQVGERGVQMSGGQKQRIAIARAIIKSPRILLLDEATSALDTKSERIVQKALDHATIGRTAIVIAHRLSTIRNADIIQVVQDGRVVESGSHDDLIQIDDGFYTSLIRLHETNQNDEHSNAYQPESSSVSSICDTHNTINCQQSIVTHSSSTNHEFPVPSFKRLLAMNRPEWKQMLFGSVSAILFGSIQPIFAITMGSMISVYFSSDHDEIKHKTMISALCFAGLAVLFMIVNIIQHYNFTAMGEYLAKKVRERILSKILTFEIGWFDHDENSTGAICSRLTNDANVVRLLVGDRFVVVIQTVSTVTIACTMGLVIAWKLALVMIAVQPIIIICFHCKQILLKKMSQKAMKSQEESSKLAVEAVSNLRTVTAFSSQTRILKMLQETQKAPLRESLRQSWYAGLGLGFSQSLIVCTWALDYWYGAKLIRDGHIRPRAFFQTYMIIVGIGRAIADVGTMANDLAKGFYAVQSVFSVLDRNTKIEADDCNGKKPEIITGHVEIRDVDFAYPARPDVMIFKGFSINIEAGKSTALVGQSGSGKSTIIGLIERFYDPMKGVVKVDERDIKSYHLRTLRKYIALVSQEPALFAGSIRENITYGASGDVSESEIIEAAKAANVHDFIAVLKDGYDTWCGDRGVQLSGGQKQRVAIARAILKNPAVLLLDEATSALDSQSEKVVQDALERMMVGRTSVVVAHRLSTIQSCNTIAVLEKGKVVEKGNHSSLLAKGPSGAYYSLVSLQKPDLANRVDKMD
ncbi:hypothetical protein LXL04_013326 [Taraxacum kok-saghyz]